MKILIIDNFDSFTYNLYQLVGTILKEKEINFRLDVKRNNEITLGKIKRQSYDKIIISPGPGDPSNHKYFGVCADVITQIGQKTPVLGVCLGMQGMAHYFGGKVVKARLPMHGKISTINHDKQGIFQRLPQGLKVMRYHSLVVDQQSLPNSLKVTAFVEEQKKGEDKEIMGLRHKKYPIEGIQFHPESFATEGGKKIIENFIFYKN